VPFDRLLRWLANAIEASGIKSADNVRYTGAWINLNNVGASKLIVVADSVVNRQFAVDSDVTGMVPCLTVPRHRISKTAVQRNMILLNITQVGYKGRNLLLH